MNQITGDVLPHAPPIYPLKRLLDSPQLQEYQSVVVLNKGDTVFAVIGDIAVPIDARVQDVREWLNEMNVGEHVTDSIRKSGMARTSIAHLGLSVTVVGPSYDIYISRNAKNIMTWEEGQWPTEIRDITKFAYGVIIVAGLGQSGRSMLSATMLDHIASERKLSWSFDIKIKYNSPYVVSYDTGLGNTFATPMLAIYAAMEAKPVKAINVGVIESEEMAQICYDCASIGKIVIGTVDAPDAIEALKTITRWGVPSHQVTTLTNGIIALRLPVLPGINKRFPFTEAIIPDKNIKSIIQAGDYDNLRNRLNESQGGWSFAAAGRIAAAKHNLSYDAIRMLVE